MPTTNAIEMVLFKVKSNVTENEAHTKLISLDTVLKTIPGFISRKLSKNEDDIWLDIVFYEDMACAKNAAELVMKNETALQAFSIIDEKSVQMLHFNVINSFSI